MEQQNQARITIQKEEKQGTDLSWGEILGEKEFLYFSEAKEALESLTWEDAEQISGQKLLPNPAILIKAWKKVEGNEWKQTDERVLLLFDDK